jgi:hypothetical protein
MSKQNAWLKVAALGQANHIGESLRQEFYHDRLYHMLGMGKLSPFFS